MDKYTFLRLSKCFNAKNNTSGFTMVELLVAIAIVGIISVIAAPSLNELMVKMRVDNQISEMNRLLLTARNMAINTGQNTTICPLTNANICGTDWTGEISVFTNDSNIVASNTTYVAASEELIKVKSAISSGDKLQFPSGSIIYTPSGRIISAAVIGTFSYCPYGYSDISRGIDISSSGRIYSSSDIDNDNKDENRAGSEITCS